MNHYKKLKFKKNFKLLFIPEKTLEKQVLEVLKSIVSWEALLHYSPQTTYFKCDGNGNVFLWHWCTLVKCKLCFCFILATICFLLVVNVWVPAGMQHDMRRTGRFDEVGCSPLLGKDQTWDWRTHELSTRFLEDWKNLLSECLFCPLQLFS